MLSEATRCSGAIDESGVVGVSVGDGGGDRDAVGRDTVGDAEGRVGSVNDAGDVLAAGIGVGFNGAFGCLSNFSGCDVSRSCAAMVVCNQTNTATIASMVPMAAIQRA